MSRFRRSSRALAFFALSAKSADTRVFLSIPLYDAGEHAADFSSVHATPPPPVCCACCYGGKTTREAAERGKKARARVFAR